MQTSKLAFFASACELVWLIVYLSGEVYFLIYLSLEDI